MKGQFKCKLHEIYFSLLKKTHQHDQNKTNNKNQNFCPNHLSALERPDIYSPLKLHKDKQNWAERTICKGIGYITETR